MAEVDLGPAGNTASKQLHYQHITMVSGIIAFWVEHRRLGIQPVGHHNVYHWSFAGCYI